ncbi:MAG: ATP-binding protein [Kaistella sp.]
MNFVDCHEEPIHISGHIQSYGYLLGLDADTFTIKFFSQNITDLFAVTHADFGKTMQEMHEVFSALLSSHIMADVDFSTLKDADLFLDKITLEGTSVHFSYYRLGNHIYFEFEKVLEDFSQRSYLTKRYITIHNAVDPTEIWNELLLAITEATDYDRTMVYQFFEDGSGRVIAEKVKNKVESYMNLHYPENDIPRQARELYLKNRKRIFSNVYSEPVPIISQRTEPIDLTYSSVRAMSPVHGQYVKNSGASSSFSTSIIVDHKLWGMVTCQNIEPKHIDFVNRVRAEILTTIAANAYSSYESRLLVSENEELEWQIKDLKNKFLAYDNLEALIFHNMEDMRRYAGADGFAVVIKDDIQTSGTVPEVSCIKKIADWARNNPLKNFYANHEFSDITQGNLGDIRNAAGVMFGFTDEKRHELLIWFRKEVDREVLWAGNPIKQTETKLQDGELKLTVSPRKSFETYITNIKGKAKPWTHRDILAGKKIVSAILETTYSQVRMVQELNEELKNVNEELDSFSYTISHDLGTPLTVMKLNVQLLARSLKDNPAVQNRIDDVMTEINGMEKMMRGVLNLSRAKSSEIEMGNLETAEIIHKLIYDSKLILNSEKTEVVVKDLPNVWADRTMLYQALMNVIGNAVKYSSRNENPQVIIGGENVGDQVVYTITDNGIGIPKSAQDKMFKIFNRMDNVQGYKGNGVGLSIVYRIMERLGGSISYESEENRGTTFKLTFQKPQDYL